jgi:lysozyme
MNNFTPSPTLVDAVKGFEGLRLSAYQDVGGLWTIGYGHRCHAGQPDITLAQASELLFDDLLSAGNAAQRLVTAPLSQQQYDGLTDFVFNLGAGAFASSTLLLRVNEADWDSAEYEIKRWVHAAGGIQPGLVTRRAWDAEQLTYLAPTSPNGVNPYGD